MNPPNKPQKPATAPAVYRPQPLPKVLQTKMARPSPARPQAPPAAPLTNRPQQLPKVLQTKSAAGQSPRVAQAPRRPVIPVVHRPETQKAVQPKAISPPSKSFKPPQAYRPEHKSIVQRKGSSSHGVIQRAPLARVRATGDTFLRESDHGTSLARGQNIAPVATGEEVTVDLGDVWGSHQGNGAASASAIHDWYKVVNYRGTDISGRDIYIRAATLSIARPGADPITEQELVFEAWMDHVDVGHLLMYDPQTGKSYDFKGAPGGKPLPSASVRETRLDARPDDPRVLERYKPLSHVDVMTPTGRLTGRAQPLTLNISSRADARRRQLADQRRDKQGFHAALRVTVKVTKAEYRHIILTTLVRGGGHYNFLREATVYDPLATRCLTPLEDLARSRGIRLMPGSAEWVLRQFVALSNDTVVSVETSQRAELERMG